jgi:hypothetical protein
MWIDKDWLSVGTWLVASTSLSSPITNEENAQEKYLKKLKPSWRNTRLTKNSAVMPLLYLAQRRDVYDPAGHG